MMASSTSYTEASSSRFARIQDEGNALQIHYNDIGQGGETVVMLHGSGPGRPAGPISAGISARWCWQAIASF